MRLRRCSVSSASLVQSAASLSHASLSRGATVLSACWRHSSASLRNRSTTFSVMVIETMRRGVIQGVISEAVILVIAATR